ncbi:MAG: hypothetical protein NDJ92_03610 [Thermoanaerobaculia bacterium]|nr:hypothetical protein [Thermoanaerobaculia bacterium]
MSQSSRAWFVSSLLVLAVSLLTVLPAEADCPVKPVLLTISPSPSDTPLEGFTFKWSYDSRQPDPASFSIFLYQGKSIAFDPKAGQVNGTPIPGSNRSFDFPRELNPLKPGTIYTWYVVASQADPRLCVGSPTSVVSDAALFDTLTCAPPSNVSPANGATNVATSVTLQWSAIANATSYSVLESTDGGNVYTSVATTTGTSANRTFDQGKTIFWKIRGLSNDGCPVRDSAATSFTTINCALGIPNQLGPADNSTSPVDVLFSWKATSTAIDYGLATSVDGGRTFSEERVGNVTQAKRTMPAGAKVLWYVRSYPGNGCPPLRSLSDFVVNIQEACPTGVPLLVYPKPATEVASPVRFEWTSVSGATSYELFLAEKGSSTFVSSGKTTGTTLERSVSGAVQWYVDAIFPIGCAPTRSEVGRFTVAEAACPTSGPGLVAPVDGASLQAPVTFSWSAVAGTLKYVVFARDTTNVFSIFDDVASTGSTSVSVDLGAGTWEWKVTAYPDRCDPVTSVTRTVKVSAAVCNITPPAPLLPKSGSTIDTNIVAFEWSGISQATEYTVEAAFGTAPFAPLGTTVEKSFVAKVPDGKVTWRVVATVPRCQPVVSATSTFTVAQVSCPVSAPDLLSPAPGATVSNPVKLQWTAVSGASGYRVWISVDGGSPSNLGGTVAVPSLEASLPAAIIVWYVEAIADRCPSTFSPREKFVVSRSNSCPTDRPAPIAPRDGSTGVLSPVTFEWSPVTGASGYNLFAAIDGEPAANLGFTTATKLVRELKGTKVSWWVVATFPGCDPAISDKALFSLASTDACAIVPPSRLLPVDNTSSISPVKFGWTSSGADVVYRLWVTRDGERPIVLGETLETALDRHLEPGSYSWYIEAFRKGCPSGRSDNGRFAVLSQATCPTEVPLLLAPSNGATGLSTEVRFAWASVADAVAYELWITREDGVASLVAVTRETAEIVRLRPGRGKWFVKALFKGCDATRSQDFSFEVAIQPECEQKPPYLLSPPIREPVPLANPITFEWTPVRGATLYHLFASIEDAEPIKLGETAATSTKLELPVGRIRWYVLAELPGCPAIASSSGVFFVKEKVDCDIPVAPELRAVLEAKSGVDYRVAWTAVANAGSYEIQESLTADFTSSESSTSAGVSQVFNHSVTSATRFYYRVRGISACTDQPGPYSQIVRVVVTPKEVDDAPAIDSVSPLEANGLITIPFKIGGANGKSTQATSFTASTNKPWMSVSPSSGTIPPEGLTLTITADPSVLGPGANTGTLTLETASSLNARETNAGGSSTPVSVSMVSPVTPTTKSGPTADSLIIPAVGHAAGSNSQWQSDVRISNVSSQSMNYLLFFTPSGQPGTGTVKEASVTVAPGQTVALNDVVKSWFGIGAGSESATGVMEIRPQSNAISTAAGSSFATGTSLAAASVATSRTYNLSSTGTFGQFIPAVSYSKFVGKGTTLSLQQVAQSAQYRTNVGVVEASGQPATVQFTVFSSSGQQLGQWNESLQAGEHRQYDRLLAQRGIELEGGRIEVDVVSDTGRITAYASTVDNQTGDPIFVPPVDPTGVTRASKFVVPGVGDVDNGLASWRTDVRVFNAGATATTATLTYFPQGSSTPSGSKQVSIGAGSVLEVNDLLKSTFGISNSAGALHVTTESDSALVPTARTYNKTAAGTYGQFIPAVTEELGTSLGGRTLQLPQVEQSARFRTNLGLTELSGKSATVEVTAIIPGALAAPRKTYSLAANEFRQIGYILNDMGISEAYNARVTVRVVGGGGSVSAYASVIDSSTQDPTYVPAQ